MEAATAPLLVASALLVAAGLPKLRTPAPTSGALRSVGVRVPDSVVRVGGAAEALLGAVAAVTGHAAAAALVAASYVGFSLFLVVALSRGGMVASCGCLGRPDTPPTRSHVLVTLALAGGATAAAVAGATGVIDLGISLHSVTLVALTAVTGWLAWTAFALLPHARFPRRIVKEH
jgi:hypothetical protein